MHLTNISDLLTLKGSRSIRVCVAELTQQNSLHACSQPSDSAFSGPLGRMERQHYEAESRWTEREGEREGGRDGDREREWGEES